VPGTGTDRVVSLVPSLTEAVAVTARPLLVGATDWCTHPADLDVARAAWADPPQLPPVRAVVPIWRRPWMVLGRDTFAGDVLTRLGVRNVFAQAADRYPRLAPGELAAVDAELVVLPDEPYAFGPDDGPEAWPQARAAFVSGRHLTWYGPSLVAAPKVLAAGLGLPPDSGACS
jgi:hypothetical protein